MKWTSNKIVHDMQPWTKTYNEHSVLFHLGRTARHTLYDWHEASTLKPLPCQFNKHSLLFTIIIFITPTFSCVYRYHHSAFYCHEALILKHLLSIFIFDVQYSHNHNDIGYSRSLLFKPIILFDWTRGGRYPIWFNSIFEFCQKMIHSILLHPRFNSKYYSIQSKFCSFNSKDDSIQYSGNHWY